MKKIVLILLLVLMVGCSKKEVEVKSNVIEVKSNVIKILVENKQEVVRINRVKDNVTIISSRCGIIGIKLDDLKILIKPGVFHVPVYGMKMNGKYSGDAFIINEGIMEIEVKINEIVYLIKIQKDQVQKLKVILDQKSIEESLRDTSHVKPLYDNMINNIVNISK